MLAANSGWGAIFFDDRHPWWENDFFFHFSPTTAHPTFQKNIFTFFSKNVLKLFLLFPKRFVITPYVSKRFRTHFLSFFSILNQKSENIFLKSRVRNSRGEMKKTSFPPHYCRSLKSVHPPPNLQRT